MPDVQIREHSWYHTIDLPDGSTTPGFFDTRSAAARVEWPDALRSGRCLDVGTFDGFWAFEMERRGAGSVVALDVEDPEVLDWRYDQRRSGPAAVRAWGSVRGRGFNDARERLGSKVERLVCSVYDLDPHKHGQFDVVFCGALLLHLRDPIRALEAMRSVCRGELVLLETLDPTLDVVARRIPCARLMVEHNDEWWAANAAGLRAMVHLAGFEVRWVGRRTLVPFGAGVTFRPKLNMASLVARSRGRGDLMLPLRAAPRPPSGG